MMSIFTGKGEKPMTQEEQVEALIRQFYREIHCYCISRLKPDLQGAQECTQDVFLLLTEKKAQLDLSGNIRAWLYKSADNIIGSYLRNREKHRHIPLEEAVIPTEGGIGRLLQETPMQKIRDCLTAEELELLLRYYSLKRGERGELAEQYHMTLDKLYDEIERLKRKILCSL